MKRETDTHGGSHRRAVIAVLVSMSLAACVPQPVPDVSDVPTGTDSTDGGRDTGTDALDLITIDAVDALDAPDAMAPSDVVDVLDTVDAVVPTDSGIDPRCPSMPPAPPPTGALCDTASVVVLGDEHRGADGRTRYYGTTAGVPVRGVGNRVSIPLAGARSQDRQIAHTYRMRAAGRLLISTENPATHCGSTGGHDTFIAVLNRCAPTGATRIAFNDDTLGVIWGGASTTYTPDLVPAGTELTIIVGTIAPTPAFGTFAGAPYELSIEEIGAGLAVGASCNSGPEPIFASTSICGPGLSCISDHENSNVGHCVTQGTARATCRAASTDDAGVNRCDTGLVCLDGFAPTVCQRPVTAGQACDRRMDDCNGEYWSCTNLDPLRRTEGVCIPFQTAVGATCSPTSPGCPAGSVCGGSHDLPRCHAVVSEGLACDRWRIVNQCATGSSCAPAGTGGSYVCVAEGTVAGAACRSTGTRCDPGLTCRAAAGSSTCVETLPVGATVCDVRGASQRCAGSDVCAARSFTSGACTTPLPEPAEPNGSHALASVVTSLPAVFHGTLPAGADTDCYAVDVLGPADAIYAEVSDGMGGCTSGMDTQLAVLDPSGRAVEFNDDFIRPCALIDGTRSDSPLHGVAAGRYAVCVHSSGALRPIPEYFLSLNVIRP